MQDWNAQARRDYLVLGVVGGAVVGALVAAFVGWAFEIVWPARGFAIAAGAVFVASLGGSRGPEAVGRFAWKFVRRLFVW